MVSVEAIKVAKWENCDDWESCEIDKVTFYKWPDGHCTCAEDDCWVSARFETPEAAASWSDDFNAAEVEFAGINPPTGKGANLLSTKG